MLGTFSAALVGVVVNFIFPVGLTLVKRAKDLTAPGGVAEVLKTLMMNIVDNPVHAIANDHYDPSCGF